MEFLYAALAALAILVAVVLIRALMFKPKEEASRSPESVIVDTDRVVSGLAEMVRCRTVSSNDRAEEDEGEFDRFRELLPTLFPLIYKKCTVEYPTDRSILIHWKGKSQENPTVLMSHYDVVSVVEENWERPAFSGVVENGVLWGRGTLDTKGTLNGAMQAAEILLESGFVPREDIYFAFSGNEEVNGCGSPAIVSLFRERGITPGLVLDEGGAVCQNVFPGVTEPCALIGIAEKGMTNIEYSVSSQGGHASSPKPRTPIGRLSAACVRVEKHPMQMRIPTPTMAMLDCLARRSTFLYRMIFANLWLFRPVLDILTRKTGGEMNAIMRTTTAFTMMEGSKGMNVIPPYARMISNHRLINGDTPESLLAHLKRVIKDPEVNVNILMGNNPSVVSELDCEAWERVKAATADTWTDAVVTPYLMVACSDSRHWGRISDRVYRFSAMDLTSEERATIHGNNESIRVETAKSAVEFYIRLMKQC